MRPRPGHVRPAGCLWSVVWILLLLTPLAAAQVPNPECLNCAVAVQTLEWTDAGAPGTFIGGTVRIENTGESSDSYDVVVTSTDNSWLAEAEQATTGTLAAGSGLLADTTANFVDIGITVLVARDARLGNETGIQVVVTSQSDSSVVANLSERARTIQVFGWMLECTGTATIMKATKGAISLSATNTGNGPDTAIVTTPPLHGLSIPDPDAFTLSAGETATQALDAGVGLSLEDGEYTLRWDLVSSKSNATASCTTILEVTGGTAPAPPPGSTSKDSPAPSALMVLVGIGLVAGARRYRV